MRKHVNGKNRVHLLEGCRFFGAETTSFGWTPACLCHVGECPVKVSLAWILQPAEVTQRGGTCGISSTLIPQCPLVSSIFV